MQYIGEFTNVNDITYRVIITTPTAGNNQEITLGEPAVVLSQNGGELFQNIKPQSCTITINTTEDLSDLYTNVDNGNTVTVEDVTNDKVIFEGFVTPRQYNQPYINYNVIEIECVDAISSLLNVKYEKDENTVVDNLSQVVKRYMPNSTVVFDVNVLNLMLLQFFPNAFEEDANVNTVISEYLKSTGLTMTEFENVYYIYDIEKAKTEQTITWINLKSGEVERTMTNTPINFTIDDYKGADQNIEIEPTYSTITGNANIKEYEEGDIVKENKQPLIPLDDVSLNFGSVYRGDKDNNQNRYKTSVTRQYKCDNTNITPYYYNVETTYPYEWEYFQVIFSPVDNVEMDNVIYAEEIKNLQDYFRTHLTGKVAMESYYYDFNSDIFPTTEAFYIRNAIPVDFYRTNEDIEKIPSQYGHMNIGVMPILQGVTEDYDQLHNLPIKMNYDNVWCWYSGASQLQAKMYKEWTNHTFTDLEQAEILNDYEQYKSFTWKSGSVYDYSTPTDKAGYITIDTQVLLAPCEAHYQYKTPSYNWLYPYNGRSYDNFPIDPNKINLGRYDGGYKIQQADVHNNLPPVMKLEIKVGDMTYCSDGIWRNDTTGHTPYIYIHFGEYDMATQNKIMYANKWMSICERQLSINWMSNNDNEMEDNRYYIIIPENTQLVGELEINVTMLPVIMPIRLFNDGNLEYVQCAWSPNYYTVNSFDPQQPLPPIFEYYFYQLPLTQAYTLFKEFKVEYHQENVYNNVSDYQWEVVEAEAFDSDEDEDIKYIIENSTDYFNNIDIDFNLCSFSPKKPQAYNYLYENVTNGVVKLEKVVDPFDGVAKRPEERVIQQYNRHYQSPRYVYNAQLKDYHNPITIYSATATGNKQYVIDSQQWDVMNNVNNVKLIEL